MAIQDIGTMLINLKSSFEALQGLMPTLEFATGVGFIVKGLFLANEAAKEHGNQHASPQKIGSALIFGGILASSGFTQYLANDITTLSGGALGYIPPTPSDFLTQVLTAIMTGIGAIGGVAIYRAALLFKSAADGDDAQRGGDPMWKGVWHVIGGACALNIGPFLKMVGM